MPLRDTVGVNCKNGAVTENKAHVPSILAKGCMFGICASVIRLDMIITPR